MCIYDDSRRFARLAWRLHDTFVARAAHKLLDLGQDAGDDRVDASGGRMKALPPIEPGFTGNPVEEERIKPKTVAGGEFGIDRPQIPPIVRAASWPRPHARPPPGHVPVRRAA